MHIYSKERSKMNFLSPQLQSAASLKNRHFLTLLDFTKQEIEYLLNLSFELKRARGQGQERARLQGKVIALIFEKNSTRTRTAFEVAALHQGAHTTYLGPSGTHIGEKESTADTARVLGAMVDAIVYRGYGQSIVSTLAQYSGVPVFNALTDEFHPTQVLADLLTMLEHCDKPLDHQKLVYLGDGANNMAHSLMVAAAKLGLNLALACPPAYRPDPSLLETCLILAQESGAKITLYDDPAEAVEEADFLYTDVWLSMGQPESEWSERVERLMPYRVTQALMEQSGNPEVKFLHCLPAYHDRETEAGTRFFQEFGLLGVEVCHEVFESPASRVFSQSENRLHTIKSLLVATLGD